MNIFLQHIFSGMKLSTTWLENVIVQSPRKMSLSSELFQQSMTYPWATSGGRAFHWRARKMRRRSKRAAYWRSCEIQTGQWWQEACHPNGALMTNNHTDTAVNTGRTMIKVDPENCLQLYHILTHWPLGDVVVTLIINSQTHIKNR